MHLANANSGKTELNTALTWMAFKRPAKILLAVTALIFAVPVALTEAAFWPGVPSETRQDNIRP